MSYAETLWNVIETEMPEQFTTAQLRKAVPAAPGKNTFGAAMNFFKVRGRLEKVGYGVYKKTAPGPAPGPAPTAVPEPTSIQDMGFNPLQIGEVVFDLILHLKTQVQDYQKQVREMEKEHKAALDQKAETIRLLNNKIRENQTAYRDSGRTIKLGDLARIRSNK
jgi:hypothetical protein